MQIFDLQYFLFNVVALVYFLAAFLWQTPDADGLLNFPEIPEGLLVLTGASVAGYLAQKTLDWAKPHLLGAYPGTASPGELVWVRGVDLSVKWLPSGGGREAESERVGVKGITFNGVPAEEFEEVGSEGNEFEVRVPEGVEYGRAPIRVMRGDGVETDALEFTVLRSRPVIRSIHPRKILPPGNVSLPTGSASDDGTLTGRRPDTITVLGARFGKGSANDGAPEGAAVELEGQELVVST